MSTASPTEDPVPFYKTIKRKFQDVELDPGVVTPQFCGAVDAVVSFFDLFTNAPFAIVRSDLSSKIAKLRERHTAYPETSGTLEEILKDEKEKGVVGKPEAVTGALTWLIRSLRFTCMGLRRNMANEKEEVSTSMTWAYGETLKPYHGWAIRPLFTLAMKAVPYRVNFYKVLGEPVDEIMVELDLWLGGLEKILSRMEGVYKTGAYGSVDGKP